MNLWQVFKAEYPAGKGVDADYTWQIWRQLLPDEKQAAVDGLRLWKNSSEWNNPRYIPSAGNFLAKQKWKEVPNSKRKATGGHVPNYDSSAYRQKAQDPNNYVYRKREAHG